MGFLPGLFESKSAASDKATGHAIAGSPTASALTYASGGDWDTDKAVKNGYERVMWVFRAVDAIASNQSAVPIYMGKGIEGQDQRVDNPKLNKLMNIRPNDYEDAAMFRYRLSSLALLSRRGVFIEVVGPLYDPESLHILSPGMVTPIPGVPNAQGAVKFVERYEVRDARGNVADLKPEQVIWIRTKPHPTDPYAQMTPLVAAGITAETDFFARLFNRNFLMNDGRPGLLITVSGAISNEDAQELKRRFSGGPGAAGQTSVIEADDLNVADLGATPRDVQWQEATRVSKEDLLLAFGVPESVLGNASGRTFDNADAEYELFWTHTMVPHCKALARGLDPLTGKMDDETRVVFDFSTVDVLQRQQRRREEKAFSEYQAGLITWNEYRKATGKRTWDNTLGAKIIVTSSGFAFAEDPEDQAGIMKLPNVSQLGAMGPGAQMPAIAQQQQSFQGARQGALEGTRNFDNIMSARALRLAGKNIAPRAIESKAAPVYAITSIETKEHPYNSARTKTESMLQGVMFAWGSRQAKVCADRLTHSKVRKGTRHWEGEEEKAFRGLDPYYVVQVDEWVDDMKSDFGNVLQSVLKKEALRIARDMQSSGVLQQMVNDGTANPRGLTPLDKVTGSASEKQALIDGVLNEILDVVEASTRNQSHRIAQRIQKLDDAGKSLPEIRDEVRQMVSDQSSWHKALTTNATTSAYEGIKHAVYAKGAGYIEKTWNTLDDEKVRFNHKDADGDSCRVDQPFVVGKSAMMYPGDPKGPIEEVANCRCWATYTTV